MESKEPILFEAKHITSRRKGLFQKGQYLDDISFSLPAGYIMGIVGKNGAGKTTFFDYIIDEKKRYRGEFLLNGADISKNHLSAMNQIGFISEDNYFFTTMSIRKNVELLAPFYEKFDHKLFSEKLSEFELTSGKCVGNLSRGQMMKFQLAFAMAHKPKLYLLDEATAGMDPVFRLDFYKQLRLLLEDGCGVILSTHLEEEIEKQIDYVGILEEGKMIFFGENEMGGILL